MNNPFATVPTPAAQPTLQPNPFAPQAPVQPPSFPMAPTSAPTANPFAAVVQAPPPAPPVQVPAPPTQGVAAIQAAFAFPPLNPPGEAGLGLHPVVTAPAVVVEAPAAPVVPQEPAPKARRSRKAKAIDVPTEPGPDSPSFDEGHPGGDAQDMTLGELNALADAAPAIDSATTEELRDALNARGWNVTLVAS